jgi:hypothetical protein
MDERRGSQHRRLYVEEGLTVRKRNGQSRAPGSRAPILT